MTRTPAADTFDAEVGFHPYREGKAAEYAFALVKRTYQNGPNGWEVTAPEPLARDFRDPDYKPQLPTGSDFWVHKAATDVIVLGSCYARRPSTTEHKVTATVGHVSKRVAVFGPRRLVWARNEPRFTDPEPFEEIAVARENAYGGFDGRVPMPAPTNLEEQLAQLYDHPGVYPRNPFGKGYVVLDAPVADGVELPNLEDPNDLLSPEIILVRDPTQWWRQPLPWSLDHLHPLQFPRYVYFGSDAWFPGPADSRMPEVAQGYLVDGYRESCARPNPEVDPILPGALQEGSLGFTFPFLAEGTPLDVTGMHPEGKRLQFKLPAPPEIEIAFDEDKETVLPRLTNVVIQPAEQKVMLTWVGLRAEMPRRFIPGIHDNVPLRAHIDRDYTVEYATPEPMPKKLKRVMGGSGVGC